MGAAQPIFVVLTTEYFADIDNLGTTDSYIYKWQHQVEGTASDLGFISFNYDQEIQTQIEPQEMAVNRLDYHPSAKMNRIFADKLFATIAEQYGSGQLCSP
jgi:hypothetical protein